MNADSRVLLGRTGSDISKLYDLHEVLGSGKFGDTHLCIEKATGLKYACKVIDKKKLISDEDVDHLRTEINIMMKLRGYRNIIQIKGTYEDSQKVYLVMELCEGGELYDRINEMHSDNEVHEDQAAAILKDIIQGVKVCHEHGVIHRDLKPENILYTTKERTAHIKIIDFGYSTFFTRGQRLNKPAGTVSYVAPEILTRSYGEEVDIWSVGIIFYALLTGRTPFCGRKLNDVEILTAVINEAIIFEGGIWNKISLEAKDLIKGMLNRDPKKRFTIQQILEHPWLVKHGGMQCRSAAKPEPTNANPDMIRRTRQTRMHMTLTRLDFFRKSN